MKTKIEFYPANKISLNISKIINSLEINIFHDSWNLDKCINISKNQNNTVAIIYICNKTKTPIGYIISRLCVVDIEIHRIGVIKEYRNLGIASTLIYQLIEFLSIKSSNKLEDIYLEVNEKNKKAIQLYTKLGFINFWIRPNYYNNIDDAICMKSNISNILRYKTNIKPPHGTLTHHL